MPVCQICTVLLGAKMSVQWKPEQPPATVRWTAITWNSFRSPQPHGQVPDLCFSILLALPKYLYCTEVIVFTSASTNLSSKGCLDGSIKVWVVFCQSFWQNSEEVDHGSRKTICQRSLPSLHGYKCQQKHAGSLSKGEGPLQTSHQL